MDQSIDPKTRTFERKVRLDCIRTHSLQLAPPHAHLSSTQL
jgi:hypothetical protein